jgi:DNA-binding beta-propeller fold protein YncE
MKTAGSVVALLLTCTLLACGQTTGSEYRIVDSVRLGGEGGWDYLAVDTAAQRVYVSRGSRVQVVDVGKYSVIGEIPNTPGVHGIALVPSSGKGFTSNGRDSSVTVFEMATLKTLARIPIDGRNPDAILFDDVSQRIFTFNGGSANATAIDAGSCAVVGTVPLGGKPEFAVADGKGRIYVNIEDKSELVRFDAQTLRVLHTWPLSPGEEPSGLAIDREHRRLFSVCANRLMVILDADSGRIVATVPIGEGVDGAAFDPATQCAFSSNGEGTLTVVREEAPEKYSVAGTVPTRRGARTVVLDPKTHRLYTVSAKFGPPPPATPERPRPRPTIEAGSATLYILGQ